MPKDVACNISKYKPKGGPVNLVFAGLATSRRTKLAATVSLCIMQPGPIRVYPNQGPQSPTGLVADDRSQTRSLLSCLMRSGGKYRQEAVRPTWSWSMTSPMMG